LKVEKEEIPILIEEFDFGKFVKIESPSPEMLETVLDELGLDKADLIEKNSAELLAEELNMIQRK
jgi:hypothetical protein